jgi:hypothetical protein
MKTRISVLATALVALATANGWAGGPSELTAQNSPGTVTGTHPDVTITGQRAELAHRISAYVNQVTAFDPADPGQGLARWMEPVCPLVTGLPHDEGEFILGRLSEIARAASVPLAGEQCRPNLYVFVSSRPEELLRAMDKRNSRFTFADASPPLIEQFMATPRAVRVWYHTVEKTPEGLPLLSMSIPELNNAKAESMGAQILTPGGVDRGFGTNAWSESSHLTLNAVEDIQRVFVIVDQGRLKGVTRGQLADYVAMVGLAQVKPGPGLKDAQTILTLFDGAPQAGRPGMSDWDRGFLKSLYETEQRSRLQRSQIALNMVRAIAPQ